MNQFESQQVEVEHPKTGFSRWAKSGLWKKKLFWAVLALSLALALALLAAVRHFVTRGSTAAVPVSVAADSVLRLRGVTAAVLSQSVQAPRLAGQQVSSLTITKLAPAGSRVKKGDLLVEFDRQDQLRDAIDKEAEAVDLAQQVLQAQAKEEAAAAKDKTEIVQAENAVSKARLELKKVELLSRIDAEKAQEALDEAVATLVQLKNTLALKRKAAVASIRILEIQRDRTRETMLHAQANAALMQVRSPIDGIVVYNTIWKMGNIGEVQEGDQVRPGVPFMQVVDPSRMEVHVLVNQQDLTNLHPGQPVRIHLDAYSDIHLRGQLDSIDPMGETGDFSEKIRTFQAVFSIQGSESRLMPDLSAAVDVDRNSSGGGQSR